MRMDRLRPHGLRTRTPPVSRAKQARAQQAPAAAVAAVAIQKRIWKLFSTLFWTEMIMVIMAVGRIDKGASRFSLPAGTRRRSENAASS